MASSFSPGRLRVLPLALCAVATAAGIGSMPAQASSHKEAPFIATQDRVDGTDFYMFRSYEGIDAAGAGGRSGYVTMVANYIPFQDPQGAPNFYNMDPNALYEIHIDNNGDAKEELTFQFRFKTKSKNLALNVGGKQVAIPLIQSGPISGVNPATQNVYEQYSVNVVRGDRRSTARQAITNAANNSATFDKPVDNIGAKTIADYPGYASQFVYNINIPGCSAGRMFVGQRKDPFVVNIGEIGDLINIKAPATEFDANAEKLEPDDLAKKNVTSLILEVPIACLTNGTEPVIGGYTTASVRQGRLIDPTPKTRTTDDDGPTGAKSGGAWTQVSRLGMPLVNEVVIGLKDKDRFNASKPANDGQFADYVTNPTLPALIEVLFGAAGVKAPTNFPRTDLVAAFLTGVPGVNKPANVVASEMMRLNTSIPPTPMAAQSRLGVVGGDNAGFPNGRRPGDDVVDIELRVAMGLLCTVPGVNTAVGCVATDAPSGGIHFTDGAYVDSSFYDAAFPYIKPPLPGSPNGVSD